MNIYQIDDEIMKCIDQETGEVVDVDRLNDLQMQREEKIENVGLWIKELVAEVNAISNELKTLSDRKRADLNKIDSLKAYLGDSLEGKSFKTSRVAIGFRRSESVEIINELIIDEKYLKPSKPTIDKISIKKALKAGEPVIGAELIVKNNVQVR